MSAARRLLRELLRAGVQLVVQGNRLRIKAPASYLTPSLLQRITAHKCELLTLLTNGDEGLKGAIKEPVAKVWHCVIDGKPMTIIDPDRLDVEAMHRYARERFGERNITIAEASYSLRSIGDQLNDQR